MSIPAREQVIHDIQKHFGVILQQLPRKQIIFGGTSKEGEPILVCTPGSKLHAQGHGWFDLTDIQTALLDQAKHSILAVRLENGSIYYINFHKVKPYLTKEALLNNKREGDHWKLYVWTNYIEVRGNNKYFPVEPNILEQAFANTSV